MALVDTNVLVVANARGGENPACVDACVDCLEAFIQNREVLHLDSLGHILEEYGNNIQFGTPQGVGDAFFVWALTYQATPSHCVEVAITVDTVRGYVEFPDEPSLASFDRSDRKFVAVSIASRANPTIYNATDSDWRQFEPQLSRHCTVTELC